MLLPSHGVLSISAFACVLSLCVAEQVLFEKVAAPTEGRLDGWYLFRVYTKNDFAASSGLSPLQVMNPVAQIQLVGVPTGNYSKASTYNSLEVSLIYYDHLLKQRLDPTHFCVNGQIKPATADVEFQSVVIPFVDKAPMVDVVLNKTGTYLLMISNCADFTSAHLSGVVQVRNPYGYLPPEQYYSRTPLWVFLIFYIICLLGFVACSVPQAKQFHDTHWYFVSIILLSILEVAVKLYAYHSWNSSGAEEPWMSIATVLYVLKWTFLYTVSAFIATGLHEKVQSHEASCCSSRVWPLTFLAAAVYTAMLSIRDCMLLYGTGRNLGHGIIAAGSMPALLMDAAMVVFLVTQTQKQYEDFRDRSSGQLGPMYGRLNKIAVAVAVFGVLALVIDLGHISGWSPLSWKQHWLLQEGLPHGLALFAISSGIVVMRPGALEMRSQSAEAKIVDAEAASMVGRADEDDSDEEM